MVIGYKSELAAAYSQHREVLYRVAFARLRGAGLEDEVEDVISTAIVELLERPPKEEIRNWEAYLITVVTRRAIDRIRADSKHRSDAELELQEVRDERDDFIELEEGLDTLSALESVEAILKSLDEVQRRVAHEYFWLNRKQADIANDLNLTQGRVSQIIQEVRRILQQRMKEEVNR